WPNSGAGAVLQNRSRNLAGACQEEVAIPADKCSMSTLMGWGAIPLPVNVERRVRLVPGVNLDFHVSESRCRRRHCGSRARVLKTCRRSGSSLENDPGAGGL